MPRIDPPYPSITLVLSSPPQIRNTRSSRLPAYRASHMERYHPYPRVVPERCRDRLLRTVDYRYVEDPLWEEEAAMEEGRVAINGEGANSHLQHESAVSVSVREEKAEQIAGEGPSLGRNKLAAALSDILAALRDKCLPFLTMGASSKVGQAKDT
ncbi:hypothetical protein BV20DRAFT_1048933 [Pilatotrama ljubarskyi]|nr:hypothetical protein BV20DRAFT_1048933 [Pilatotrama ljubarskyi]